MKSKMLPPALAFADRRYRHVTHSVRYSGDQRLDAWGEPGPEPAPILIFVPGGAWVSGSRKTMQGHALMTRMVGLGWICLSISYRSAPLHRWPAQIEDVKDAVFWAHDHAEEIGGDPNFIAIAGASAGGHLASLIGLESGMVDACVSLYGSYDWINRSGLWRSVFMEYLERVIVGERVSGNAQPFLDASPIYQINEFAAPMMMVHGTRDVLIHVSEARKFYEILSEVSRSTVEYLEIPGAVHAFDLVNPGQTITANRAIADFLGREREKALGLVEVAS